MVRLDKFGEIIGSELICVAIPERLRTLTQYKFGGMCIAFVLAIIVGIGCGQTFDDMVVENDSEALLCLHDRETPRESPVSSDKQLEMIVFHTCLEGNVEFVGGGCSVDVQGTDITVTSSLEYIVEDTQFRRTICVQAWARCEVSIPDGHYLINHGDSERELEIPSEDNLNCAEARQSALTW